MIRGSREHASDDVTFGTFKGNQSPALSGSESRQETAGTITPPDTDSTADSAGPVVPQSEPRLCTKTSAPLPAGGGCVLFNKYLVLRELGAGGMGKVYLVRHLKLETERALKTIAPGISSNPEWRRRFSREAKAMARLSHPHIVAVHDADVLPEGEAFIEMEFVRGQSLDKRLQPKVPMPLAWVDHILGQLCDALQVAHDMDIVHRDLKPPNLMLQDGPSPGQETLKILDFGIAKILNSSDPGDELTQLGQSLGTPSYMSPEQIGGEIEAVKATSDIYSVGVILYKLLTGYLPFTGGQNQVLLGHLSKSPPLFAEKNPEVHVPPEVEALVLRCLEKDPKRRPPSARALAEEFHRLVAPPSEPSPSSPAHRLYHRRSWLALAGVMSVGVLGVPLLLLIRPPLPGEFTVTAEPSSLEVAAGEDAQLVRLQIGGGKPGTKVDVSFPDRPADVETKQVGTFFGELFEFQVTADLNAKPTSEPIALNLRVQAGHNVRELLIPLRIVRPTVAPLPVGFQAAEGSRLQKLAKTKIYPDRVVRRLSDRLSVSFLLIAVEPGDGGPTSPFYIMENKVWNELLDAFLEAQRGAAQGLIQDLAQRRAALLKQPGTWPVFSITAQEAQEFARRLVPSDTLELRGDLPTREQWDKASGFYDRQSGDSEFDDRGPFLRGWSPNAMGEIAIGRERKEPLPVGTATKDRSRFGCRDMAGNGMEWTRPLDNHSPLVDLRGCKFDGPQPFLFEDPNKKSEFWTKPKSWIGFRLVIEGL